MRIVSFLQGQCRFADVSQPSNESLSASVGLPSYCPVVIRASCRTEIRGKNGWDVNQVTLKCSWLRVCKAEDVAGLIDRDSQRVSAWSIDVMVLNFPWPSHGCIFTFLLSAPTSNR